MKGITPKIYIGAVIIAIVFFLVGLKVGERNTVVQGPQGAFGMRGGTGMMGGAGGRMMRGGGFTSGTVVSSDDKSVTISLKDGGTKTIYISDTTAVLKSTTGTKTDLKAGTTVMVNGSANQDGSIAAQSIQIRPETPVTSTPAPKQ